MSDPWFISYCNNNHDTRNDSLHLFWCSIHCYKFYWNHGIDVSPQKYVPANNNIFFHQPLIFNFSKVAVYFVPSAIIRLLKSFQTWNDLQQRVFKLIFNIYIHLSSVILWTLLWIVHFYTKNLISDRLSPPHYDPCFFPPPVQIYSLITLWKMKVFW